MRRLIVPYLSFHFVAKRVALQFAVWLTISSLVAIPTSLSAQENSDIPLADLEKTPLPDDWTVEGYAFGTRQPGSWKQEAAKRTDNQKQYQKGRLTSPEFTVERDYLVVQFNQVKYQAKLCTFYHPTKLCVALLSDGQDVRRLSKDRLSPLAAMDVRALKGKKVKLQIRDAHANGWLDLGRICQTDNLPSGIDAQTDVPSWEPATFEQVIDKDYLLLPISGMSPLQEVRIEIDGEEVLVVDLPLAMHGGDGAYHIGQFNGRKFTPTTPKKLPYNFGKHHYAAQTFSNTPGNPPRRVQVVWQNSVISFPTELKLHKTPLGVRMCTLPIAEIKKLYTKTIRLDGTSLKPDDPNPLKSCEGGLYDIDLVADVRNAKELLFTIRSKPCRFDVKSSTLHFEGKSVTLPMENHRLTLRALVDNRTINLFAGNKGLFNMPFHVDRVPSEQLCLKVTGGTAKFETFKVHQLKRIWDGPQIIEKK